MWSPLVSIIIPSYNRESLIGETLTSIIKQTYTHWECIVVDDGSTDRSMEVLRQFQEQDTRIKVFSRDRLPKGAPMCRNIGLAKASGDYVIYLDSDDVLAPFCLEQRVTLFQENSGCQFLVFKALLFKKEVNDADRVWNIETDENDLVRFLRMDALWQTTGPIYKRDYLMKMNGFKEELPFWQDFDLHLRCLFSGAVYKKFFDHPADYYIRTGRTDTISRSTAFTANSDILAARIKYYYELILEIEQFPYAEKEQMGKVVNSTLYFFCAQFLMRFSKPREFIRYWNRAQVLSTCKYSSTSLSIAYAFLLKLALRYSLFTKLVVRYSKLFDSSLPDYYIWDKSRLEKVRIDLSSTKQSEY